MLTVYYLNESFYTHPGWAKNSGNHPYLPIPTATTGTFQFINNKTKPPIDFTINITKLDYYKSVNRSEGWWDPRVFKCCCSKRNGAEIGNIPLYVARYNPAVDTGAGILYMPYLFYRIICTTNCTI